MTQSMAPPTRKLVSSAKRRPRSARTPSRSAISSSARSRASKFVWSIDTTVHLPRGGLRLFTQQIQQLIAHAIHGTSAKRHYQVTRLHTVAQNRRRVFQPADVVDIFMPKTFDSRRQRVSIHTFDWILTGSIDIGDEE